MLIDEAGAGSGKTMASVSPLHQSRIPYWHLPAVLVWKWEMLEQLLISHGQRVTDL